MKITGIDLNNNIKDYDVILTYHSEKFNKDYIVYTDNTYQDGSLNIYLSYYDSTSPEVHVNDIPSSELEEINKVINDTISNMLLENNKLTQKDA